MAHTAIDEHNKVIRVSGVVIFDPQGLLLTVRKWKTSRFMLPGGKPEEGENAQQAAARECFEEIGILVGKGDLQLLGDFHVEAANEPGYAVKSTIFVLKDCQRFLIDALNPAAEIAELRWLNIDATLPNDLAPLLERQVIPSLQKWRAKETLQL